jgi:hypothetical protein
MTGASVSQTGLSQAEPEEVSALTGFDPSRVEDALLRDFWKGTTADAVWLLAMETADPLERAVLMEASSRLKWAAEMLAPNASAYSYCWTDADLRERAEDLVRSMAATKCKNKYPVGVIGAEARAHYTEARRIAYLLKASAIEAGTAATTKIDAVHESAAPQEDAR